MLLNWLMTPSLAWAATSGRAILNKLANWLHASKLAASSFRRSQEQWLWARTLLLRHTGICEHPDRLDRSQDRECAGKGRERIAGEKAALFPALGGPHPLAPSPSLMERGNMRAC